MIALDRFTWIPSGIGTETPRCVLDEWAETLGIQPALYTSTQLIPLLHERNRFLASTVLPATGPASPDHWSRLAQFLNPRCKWTHTALTQAWQRLGRTLQDGPAGAPDGEVGWPTPKAPRRVPVSLAYGCLVHRGVYVPPHATPAHLAELLHMSKTPVGEAGMRKAILTLLHARPTSALSVWSFLVEQSRAVLAERYVPGPDQAERIRTLFQRWESRMFKAELYEPRTHDEAVLLAAMQYGVDIHTATNPLHEYTHLVLSIAEHAGKSRSQLWGCIQYTHPVDPALATWTARTPSALSLAHTYIPVFPVELWTHDAAKDLAERWGKSATHASHVMTTHEFLQWRAVAYHFYAGIPQTPTNTQTPVALTEVSDLPSQDAVAYGNAELGYAVMAWQELQQWLDASHQASWPAGKGTVEIDACALDQLERMAKDRHWYPLVQSVRAVKEDASDERKAVHVFVLAYREASLAEQQSVDTVLWAWLYFGMAMRGWKAEPPASVVGLAKTALYITVPFPLHDTDVEPGDTLDLRIHRWSGVLYDALDACTPAWRTRLAGARLQLFTDGQYVAAHDRDQGLTLEDRLRLLTRTDNVHACVRLSSNWMCSSAYYYLTQVGGALPFSIRDLVRIA